MPDACLFCRIIRREVAAPVVFETDTSLAFLDHRPLFPGHCLLVPKSHYPTLRDLPPDLLRPLFIDVQLLAGAVQDAMSAQGTFVAMNNGVSQSVPHLHVHVVPRTKGDGLKGFFWPRTRYTSEDEVAAVQQRIMDAVGVARGAAVEPSEGGETRV